MLEMKENFLVLNFLEDEIEFVFLKFDLENKEIEILSVEKRKPPVPDHLRKIFHPALNVRPHNVILALDSLRAITDYETVSLHRDKPHEMLDEAEIENLISQALWKLYEQGRLASARRLNLKDLETLLADTRVYDFKIDNHRVINPVGYRGSRIDISLGQTFTGRTFLRDIESVLPKRSKLVLVREGGAGLSHLLSRINSKNFIFAKTGRHNTDLFMVKPINKTSFLGRLEWGRNKLYEILHNELKIEFPESESIVEKLVKNEFSRDFGRKFRKIISLGLVPLIKGLKNAISKSKSDALYLDFSPFGSHSEHLAAKHDAALINDKLFPKMILPINKNRLFNFFGFQLKVKNRSQEPDLSSLGALLEYYFLPKEDLFNHLARRRMRWLMAQ